jgi:hypothetical protein
MTYYFLAIKYYTVNMNTNPSTEFNLLADFGVVATGLCKTKALTLDFCLCCFSVASSFSASVPAWVDKITGRARLN